MIKERELLTRGIDGAEHGDSVKEQKRIQQFDLFLLGVEASLEIQEEYDFSSMDEGEFKRLVIDRFLLDAIGMGEDELAELTTADMVEGDEDGS